MLPCLFFIQGQLFKHSLPFLIDTGSAVSLLQSAVWNQSKPPGTVLRLWVGNKLVGVNGTNLHIQGSANVTITSYEPSIYMYSGGNG